MSPSMAAFRLVEELIRIAGTDGTICMPTHPLDPRNPGFMYDKSNLVLSYSVKNSLSSVGLLSEAFRRTAGVERSAHPLSSLAVWGPLSGTLLHDNLNARRPLPHGRHSGYFRFCELGGVVIGLGVSLIKALTVLHVAEEVCDTMWPVQQFFYERRFQVRDASGHEQNVVVRERRPEFVRSYARSLVRADFLRHGILNETEQDGVSTHIADSRLILHWLQEKQQHSTYPYFLPKIAKWMPARRAVVMENQGPM